MTKMSRSITWAFDELVDFETALGAACRGLVVTGRGQFRAQLTVVTLHRLRLSAAEEQLSRIAFVAVPADMVIIVFQIGNGTLPIRCGVRARPDEIMILPPGEHLHVRSDGLHHWGSIWIPVVDLVRYSGALIGTAYAVPPVAQRWRPPLAASGCLRSLHAAAMRVAANRPQLIVDARAAYGLEQQLIDAVVECLSAGSGDERTILRRQHHEIMVCFEHLLQAQPERDFRMSEICGSLTFPNGACAACARNIWAWGRLPTLGCVGCRWCAALSCGAPVMQQAFPRSRGGTAFAIPGGSASATAPRSAKRHRQPCGDGWARLG
jgi:hypothetical protein